ncbi:hypothetical protein AGMMS49521_3570 [Campylobacterota bacterium]|nr:hypothetical protein AGMMS49521_3570 [Campylobacterota bacterium]
MSNTALIQAWIEPEPKNDVDAILCANGLDIPTAIRMFFAKVHQVGGIPFDIRGANAEPLTVMEEANKVPQWTLR